MAETGYTDAALAKDVKWLSRAYDDMRRSGGVALAYWDCSKPGYPSNAYDLTRTAERSEFAAVLARSDRASEMRTGVGRSGEASFKTGSPSTEALLKTASPTTQAGAEPLARVKVRAVGKRKLFVNGNPNMGRRPWKFRLEERRASGSWRVIKAYKTKGSKETQRIGLPRGRYRVVVKGKFGHRGSISSTVRLGRDV